MRRYRAVLPLLAALSLLGAEADPIGPVVLALAVILVAAKLGADLAARVGQPAVLGELVAGVVLGNLTHAGFSGLEFITHDATVDMLARIGVLILLFEVGLESTVPQMLSVGATAVSVAVVGVVAPFGLGWLVGAWLLPDQSAYVHAFIGATLCATSVGITARVLRDLGRSESPEARVILGAAVIDDVLGLVVLAVVTGMITAAGAGERMAVKDVGTLVAKAAVFLGASLAIGVATMDRLFRAAAKLRARGVLLGLGLAFCFGFAWLAGAIGLAPIVGAYAAGLILEDLHYREYKSRGEPGLDVLVAPIAGFLVPVFFVLMGMRTDLRMLTEPGALGLAAALTVAAVLGKQACALGVRRGFDRLSIGIGMVPRGEVGLIFANVGLGLMLAGEPVISRATYAALVVMVIVTTVITPPALAWSLRRGRSAAQ